MGGKGAGYKSSDEWRAGKATADSSSDAGRIFLGMTN